MINLKRKIKQFFCSHKYHSNLVVWHWFHGYDGNTNGAIEGLGYCKKCGKYFSIVRYHQAAYKFAQKYEDRNAAVIGYDYFYKYARGELS